MAGMMDIILYGGLAIVGLNIFKPDILPSFLQIPQLQNLIQLPGAGGAGGDAGTGGDTTTPPSEGDPAAADGKGGAGGSTGSGTGGGGKKRKGRKHKRSGFASAYPVYAGGYGREFYG